MLIPAYNSFSPSVRLYIKTSTLHSGFLLLKQVNRALSHLSRGNGERPNHLMGGKTSNIDLCVHQLFYFLIMPANTTTAFSNTCSPTLVLPISVPSRICSFPYLFFLDLFFLDLFPLTMLSPYLLHHQLFTWFVRGRPVSASCTLRVGRVPDQRPPCACSIPSPAPICGCAATVSTRRDRN